MCDPVTAGVVMGTAQTGMSIKQQRNNIATQKKVQKNASDQERQRYLNEVSQTRLRERQEQIAAAQKMRQGQTEVREARATARLSAGESGVGGLSVDAIINDLTRQEGEYNASIQQQLAFSDQATSLALEGAGLGFTNNMLRINKPIAKVNYLGAALEGAQTGLSMYSSASKAGLGSSKNVIDAPDVGTYGVDYGVMKK